MNRIISLLFVAIGVISHAWADNLSINDVTLECYQAELQINYQFDVENQYSGYQMVLALPEGVSTVKDANGAPLFTKGECYDASYTISSNFLDGTDRFVALSLSSVPMSGEEGLLLSIPIVCDKDLEVGTVLHAKLFGISFGKTDGKTTVNMPDVNFNITVGNPWITLDETSETLPPTTDETIEILVKRSIPANQWNTICLPFEMTAEQVKEVFGEDVELAEFMDYEVNDDDTQISVNFETALLDEDGFMANYPYIIKTTKDIGEFKVTAVLEPCEDDAYVEYDNGKTGKKREVYGTFYGTLKAGTILPQYSIFMNGGNFWYSAGKSKMKAFRGYFEFVDILASPSAASTQMTLTLKNGTTGIEEVISVNEDESCYDLQGRKIRKPVKGVYIQKGKKILVK